MIAAAQQVGIDLVRGPVPGWCWVPVPCRLIPFPASGAVPDGDDGMLQGAEEYNHLAAAVERVPRVFAVDQAMDAVFLAYIIDGF